MKVNLDFNDLIKKDGESLRNDLNQKRINISLIKRHWSLLQGQSIIWNGVCSEIANWWSRFLWQQYKGLSNKKRDDLRGGGG